MEVSGQPHVPNALAPEKGPAVPIGQEAGWEPEPAGTLCRVGNRTQAVQPVARRYTKRTVQAPDPCSTRGKFIVLYILIFNFFPKSTFCDLIVYFII
jgi:hypothetical protein